MQGMYDCQHVRRQHEEDNMMFLAIPNPTCGRSQPSSPCVRSVLSRRISPHHGHRGWKDVQISELLSVGTQFKEREARYPTFKHQRRQHGRTSIAFSFHQHTQTTSGSHKYVLVLFKAPLTCTLREAPVWALKCRF